MTPINPYESPQESGALHSRAHSIDAYRDRMWRDGNLLVISHGVYSLPNICVKSNQPCGTRRLMAHLGFRTVTERWEAHVLIALSDEWWNRRRRAYLLGYLIIFAGAAAFLIGLAMPELPKAIVLTLIVGGFASIIGGGVYAAIKSSMVWARKIDRRFIWIDGVHPDYLDALPPLVGTFAFDPRFRVSRTPPTKPRSE